jgi:hypothetical protein
MSVFTKRLALLRGASSSGYAGLVLGDADFHVLHFVAFIHWNNEALWYRKVSRS